MAAVPRRIGGLVVWSELRSLMAAPFSWPTRAPSRRRSGLAQTCGWAPCDRGSGTGGAYRDRCWEPMRRRRTWPMSEVDRTEALERRRSRSGPPHGMLQMFSHGNRSGPGPSSAPRRRPRYRRRAQLGGCRPLTRPRRDRAPARQPATRRPRCRSACRPTATCCRCSRSWRAGTWTVHRAPRLACVVAGGALGAREGEAGEGHPSTERGGVAADRRARGPAAAGLADPRRRGSATPCSGSASASSMAARRLRRRSLPRAGRQAAGSGGSCWPCEAAA